MMVMVIPSTAPSSRFIVYKSAIACVGWSLALPPFITGILEASQALSIMLGSLVRRTTESICKLFRIDAVSSM